MKKDICKLDYYRGKKILMKKQLSDGTWIFTVKGKKGKEDFIVKAQLPSGNRESVWRQSLQIKF